MEADTVDDGPSPTDAEFDAAIDLAWQGDDNFAHPGTLIADALAGLLTLCGRGTDLGDGLNAPESTDPPPWINPHRSGIDSRGIQP